MEHTDAVEQVRVALIERAIEPQPLQPVKSYGSAVSLPFRRHP